MGTSTLKQLDGKQVQGRKQAGGCRARASRTTPETAGHVYTRQRRPVWTDLLTGGQICWSALPGPGHLQGLRSATGGRQGGWGS